MKKILSLVLASGLLLAGCSEFDDSKILSELDSHAARIKSLEEQCSKLNTNIGSMQSILDALNDNDYVKSVTPVTEGGKTVGYTIAFTKSGSVTIYHGEDGADGANGTNGKDGKTPVIGVRAGTDGLYYWTVDGSWLLDGSGDKVAATGPNGAPGVPGTPGSNGKDGVSPKLKIEGGFWFVSYDGGSSWTKLYAAQGEPGDSFFSDVSVGGDTVVFTLSDGTKFTLPMASSSLVSFLSLDDQVVPLSGGAVVASLKVPVQRVKSVFASIDLYDAAYTRSVPGWSTSLSVDESKKTVTVTVTPDASARKVLLTLTLVLTDGSSHSTSKVIVSTGGVIDPAAVDLSTGGTANCYVVTESGTYKFPTVKGNSSESVGQVAYAEVLWEAKTNAYPPAKGELLGDAVWSDGYIAFTTRSSAVLPAGNAVIAAKDASGKILWSWHIWLTNIKPGDHVYKNNAGTMMDRNLGALTNSTVASSLGLLYQWGRKDPFLNSAENSWKQDMKMVASTNSSSWTTEMVDEESGTIDYAVAHPTTFLVQLDYSASRDWVVAPNASDAEKNRWHPSKTIYDPCPPGYRVPDGDVWAKAFGESNDFVNDETNSADTAYNFGRANTISQLTEGNTCWYILAGQMQDNHNLTYTYSEGLYWSCDRIEDYAKSLFLLDGVDIYPSATMDICIGGSVRCMKQ